MVFAGGSSVPHGGADDMRCATPSLDEAQRVYDRMYHLGSIYWCHLVAVDTADGSHVKLANYRVDPALRRAPSIRLGEWRRR